MKTGSKPGKTKKSAAKGAGTRSGTAASPRRIPAEAGKRVVARGRTTAATAKPRSSKASGSKAQTSRAQASKPPSRPTRTQKRAKPSAPAGHVPIYYRLHSLLHTVQVIARFEDLLAGLLHEVGHAGTLNEEALEDLHNLLLDIPSSSYHAELDALHEAVHALDHHGLRRRSA